MTEGKPNFEKGIGSAGHPDNSAPGLNDNLQFMGRQLHVQTERIGFPVPSIVTQVFSNGRVVFSKKSEIPSGGLETTRDFADMMRNQHLQIIREIEEKQKRFLNSKSPEKL